MQPDAGEPSRAERDQETLSSSTVNAGTETTCVPSSSEVGEGGTAAAHSNEKKVEGTSVVEDHNTAIVYAPNTALQPAAIEQPQPVDPVPERLENATSQPSRHEPDRPLPGCVRSLQRCAAAVEAHNERQAQKLRIRRAERRGEDVWEEGQLGPAGVAAVAGGAEVPHGADGTHAAWGIREAVDNGDAAWQKYGMVPVVLAILLWVLVVFLWRLVVPMLRQNSGGSHLAHPVPLGTRAEGIVLLIIFSVLWLITMWAYVRIVVTEPGFAKDHVPISDAPTKMPAGPYPGNGTATPSAHNDTEPRRLEHSEVSAIPIPQREGGASSSSLGVHTPAIAPVPSPLLVAPPTPPRDSHDVTDQDIDGSDANVSDLVIGTPHKAPDLVAAVATSFSGVGEVEREEGQDAQLRDKEGRIAESTVPEGDTAHVDSTHGKASTVPPGHPHIQTGVTEEPKRCPPTHPVLAPVNRYCHRCRRVKPPRAHHCRRCGTCVLRMDHHCPWVGGCVGARNHKFFLSFVLWVTLLEVFMLITTAILFSRGSLHKPGYERWTTDGFVISLFPIIGFFTMFTAALLFTHVYLLSLNITTIEHLTFDRLASRENFLLSRWFSNRGGGYAALEQQNKAGLLGTGCGLYIRQKAHLHRAWNREWGRPKTEGNLWWIGGPQELNMAPWMGLDEGVTEAAGQGKEANALSNHEGGKGARRFNLELTLGDKWWKWIFPLGHAPSDGLAYPFNPRFTHDGVWRRRTDWPKCLQ